MSESEEKVSENSLTETPGKVFSEGDLVVYPNHGAGCVSGVEEKTILGEERRYYVVFIPDAELTLSIPSEGDSGLRACADEESAEVALSVLRGEATEMPQNWNQRLKFNQAKLRDGEISQVAEVVRNLSSYGGEHNLSTGERNMLMKARRILVSEIALVRDTGVKEAEELVDAVLREGITEDAT
ncbi:MAG: CarD family transcriptional regulator [Rubrobacteraceae bacterium]